MKKFFLVILFIPLILIGQEKNSIEKIEKPIFKITKSNGEIFKAKNYKENKKKKIIDIQTLDGKIIRFKSSKITSIVEIKKDWNYFVFSEEGFTDYSVVNIESLSKEDLYVLVKNWIMNTYNTPSSVIKAEIENKKIRIQALRENVIKQKVLLNTFVYDMLYSIEISVRDGKYKFDPIRAQYWFTGAKYSASRYVDIPIFNSENLSSYYNQKGRLKDMWRLIPNIIETHFNNLNISLYNYINKNKESSIESEDDW